ncbi:DUF1254 domain-containing protein [Colwelliaceae bacterium BS250]
MKKSILSILIASTLIANVSFADNSHWQDLADLPFPNGYPTKAAQSELLDELKFQRAVQTYLWALPAMNVSSMRRGMDDLVGTESNTLAIWKDRIDYHAKISTANSDVIYAFNWLDLKKEGPMVLDMPPKLQGLMDDMWHRPLSDIGGAGPDRGKGGKFLVLPPGYEGEVPEGYYVVRSKTYRVFVFLRAFVLNDDTNPGVSLLEQTKIYPLSKVNDQPKMSFPNMSGVDMAGDIRRDARYFDELAEFINYEAVSEKDMVMRGMLESIGIEKGKPFNPNKKDRALFDKAAKVAFKMAASQSYLTDESTRIYDESLPFAQVFINGNARFDQPTYHDLDSETAFFHKAYSTSDAMVLKMIGKGSQYVISFEDDKSQFLDGSKEYRFIMPANVPVANYWSVTGYDADSRSLIETTDQPYSAVSSTGKINYNADGTATIYMGTHKPANPDANWIQTEEGKGFFFGIRLYSPLEPFFDQSWKPGTISEFNYKN